MLRLSLPPHILIPLIVACALFMEQVDATVLSTSLPAIAADLNEDPVALKLALTSYLLSLAVFIPASGWAADRFGARTVFRAAIVVFTLGSVLCGLSTSLLDFVIYRIIQGMGGAMMVPVGRLVILRAVPKTELVSALAWLTIPALLGPVFGPPLGGFITTYFDWRFIFFINVPIGILGVLLASRFIENIREQDVPPLDLRGLILSGIGLAGLVFGFAMLGQPLVPMWVALVSGAVGAATMALYVHHAHTTPHAILDLKLLRYASFRAGVVGGALFRVGVGAIPFLLPLMLQLSFGLSPFASGMLTFAAAAGALFMKFTAAPILQALSYKRVLVVNAILASAFLAASAAFTPFTAHWIIVMVLLVGGFLRSLQFTALNALTYAEVSQQEMSHATSFASVVQQISLSMGVAFSGLVLEMMRSGRGEQMVTQIDFVVAFLAVSLVSAGSVFFFLRMPANAGEELIGRKKSAAELAPDPRRDSDVPH